MLTTLRRQVTLPENAKIMIRDLEEQIHSGKLLQGNRVPSLRELMRRYNVSLGSAKRALDVLCEKKLLVTRPGAGTFVNSVPSYTFDHAETSIMVFLEWSVDQGGIYSAVFEGVRECAMHHSCSLMFSYLGGDKFSREEVEKMAGDVSGVILLSEYDRCTDDFGLNVPAVGVGWHSSMNGRVSVIDLDPFDAADIAVKYFKQKHAETVNVITVDYPSMLLRADSFANSWERAGGNVKVTISKKLDYKELRFEPGEFYLFSSSWALQTSAVAYQQRTGRELASDASIIGIDGRNLLIPQGIKADTIMPDWKEVGRRAFYECVARIKHPGRSPARIYLPCSLHLAGE